MGCFYTLTPRLIERLGFFDEESFPVRGHSHVDYTLRACRVEANDTQYLYDISGSNEFIGMIMRDGYKRTHRTLSVWGGRLSTSDESLASRESVLLTEGRDSSLGLVILRISYEIDDNRLIFSVFRKKGSNQKS